MANNAVQEECHSYLENCLNGRIPPNHTKTAAKEKKVLCYGLKRGLTHPLSARFDWVINANKESLDKLLKEDLTAADALLIHSLKETTLLEESGYIVGRIIPEEYTAPPNLPASFYQGLLTGRIIQHKIKQFAIIKNLYKTAAAIFAASYYNFLVKNEPPQHDVPEYLLSTIPLCKILPAAGCAYGLIAVKAAGLYRKDTTTSNTLRTTGVFALHRNPMFAGYLGGLWGHVALGTIKGMQFPNSHAIPALITGLLAATFTYFVHQKCKWEEKDLQMEFGANYHNYCSKTPRFVPGLGHLALWIQRKIKLPIGAEPRGIRLE